MTDLQTVTVTILDKEYQIACPGDEVDALTRSARFLGDRMAEIRNSGKVVGLDRIAVMAALNITHEFLTGEHAHTEAQGEVAKRIDQLNDRVGKALAQHKQLDL